MSGGRYEQRAAHNAVWLAAARVGQVALAFVTGLYLARVLGPAGYGVLGFGGALLSYFALAVVLGLDLIGTRETARRPHAVRHLAGDILGVRIALAVAMSALYLAAVGSLDKPLEYRLALGVLGLSLPFQAVNMEWVFMGTEQMRALAFRNVVAAGSSLVLAFAFVRSEADVVWAAGALAVGTVAGTLLLGADYWRQYGTVRPKVRPRRWAVLLRSALPVAASALMIAVYYSLDRVLLGFLRTEAEVGLYEAAYKVFAAAVVPSTVCYQAFFPLLSAARGDAAQRLATTRSYARAMMALGPAVAVGGGLLAYDITLAVYGAEYASSGGVLSLLMVSAGLVYVANVYAQPLLAWGLERRFLMATAAGAAVNTGLNVLLIPKHGASGAAVATVAAEVAALLGMAVPHVRTLGQNHLDVIARGTAAAAVGVAGPILGVRAVGGPWWAGALAAVAAYPLAASGLGLVSPSAVLSFLRPSQR